MLKCDGFTCGISDNIAMIFQSAVLAVLVSIFLSGFYGKIRMDWPEKYTSITNVMEYKVRSGFFYYYILFRAVPVALLSLLVVVVLEREGGYPWAAVIFVLLVHLGSTNLRAVGRSLVGGRWRARPVVLIHHLLVTAVILATSIVVVLFRRQLGFLIPSLESLVQALWSALFIAILLFLFRENGLPFGKKESDLIGRLISDVGEKVWRGSEEIALKYSIDPVIVRAIILAEVEQRPRWIRSLERIKGRVLRVGTYGVAQMHAKGPLSDLESIELLSETLQEWGCENIDEGNDEEIWEVFLRHNGDRDVAKRMMMFYHSCRDS